MSEEEEKLIIKTNTRMEWSAPLKKGHAGAVFCLRGCPLRGQKYGPE